MPALLEGIRLIELGTTITAPLAARLLADMGADVIKVERPDGDPFRGHFEPINPYFEAYNRNKRSVVIDLGKADGGAKLMTLLAGADVFLDNVRPGVLKRLGVDPDDFPERLPKLIHCSITGFGTSGPYRARPAYDAVAQGLAGMTSLFIDPADPHISGPTIPDNITGMYASIAILGALNARSRTGRGTRLEVNMFEATMAYIGDQFTAATMFGRAPQRFDRVAGSQSFVSICADGLLIAIHLSSLEKFWTGLVAALDAPELANDERFRARPGRIENYAALGGALRERFARRPRADWEERLTAYDVPFAPVYNVLETLEDPHVRATGTVYEVDDGHGGALTGIHPPLLVDGRRTREMTRAPTLGEHTAELT
jgi:crotonobetainyl-CoA:carnitine CoA-transferase CaiB-like acyl-CoA transferase